MVFSIKDLFVLLSAAYHISWNERSLRMQCSEVSVLIMRWSCRVKNTANCTLLTETSSAWPILGLCQRACRLPKKLKKKKKGIVFKWFKKFVEDENTPCFWHGSKNHGILFHVSIYSVLGRYSSCKETTLPLPIVKVLPCSPEGGLTTTTFGDWMLLFSWYYLVLSKFLWHNILRQLYNKLVLKLIAKYWSAKQCFLEEQFCTAATAGYWTSNKCLSTIKMLQKTLPSH